TLSAPLRLCSGIIVFRRFVDQLPKLDVAGSTPGARGHGPEPAPGRRPRARAHRARGRLLRRAQALPQRGLLLGHHLPGDGLPGGHVPGPVRPRAHRGLDREVARDGAGRGAEDRPPAAALPGPRAARLRAPRGARGGRGVRGVSMLKTRLCELLGIDLPIIAAPMGFVTGPELAAAVSNAGGLGVMSFSGNPPPVLREEIRRLRRLTRKPFGVNLILFFPIEDHVAVCLEERVPVLSLFWGDPAPYVARAHAAGVMVMHQVGSVAAARRAAAAGVTVIVAQGVEAGGHVEGTVGTMVRVPRVGDAIPPTPVAAAGGIADARGLVAALALGAQAAVLGTRFLATREAAAHPP